MHDPKATKNERIKVTLTFGFIKSVPIVLPKECLRQDWRIPINEEFKVMSTQDILSTPRRPKCLVFRWDGETNWDILEGTERPVLKLIRIED